ncbi:septum site-determining protein MinC [Zhaonella formicivorans]|jgi:septum site-determining protein MinC|uniref:septum site-determining protein MinC n=1 Tax=Zhaonella formicivorans TaxID=2528593 RepID=UPI0010E8281A|nr:septum site-determining protein MinC [Zhaonella formicivorans]
MNQDIINIKGTRNGLIILINPAYDFEVIKAKLQDKISSAKGFFAGAKFALQSPQQYSSEERKQLTEICCQNGLILDKVIECKTDGAIWTGTKLPKQEHNTTDKEIFSSQGLLPGEKEQNCLLVKQNLRNGQVLHYSGHITVLGDVHPGAQITAVGNILVMGTLKGIAHAGASGNRKAVIMAYNLLPTQLRIADVIARAPEQQKYVGTYPEIAYLSGGQIIIEEYNTSRSLSLTG